ncbi:MAG: hypothetical protein ACQEVA_16295 [Myxococcota bacterium]
MLGDEISDALWERLHARMSGDTCPGCRQRLDRAHIELQPVEGRVQVKCLRCDYTYLDNGNGVLTDVENPDISQEFGSH